MASTHLIGFDRAKDYAPSLCGVGVPGSELPGNHYALDCETPALFGRGGAYGARLTPSLSFLLLQFDVFSEGWTRETDPALINAAAVHVHEEDVVAVAEPP